jgi:hypothetical protein
LAAELSKHSLKEAKKEQEKAQQEVKQLRNEQDTAVTVAADIATKAANDLTERDTTISQLLDEQTAAKEALKNLREDTDIDISNLRAMRHNILTACFGFLGLQGPYFLEEPMEDLDALTNTHSVTITRHIEQLYSLRDNILIKLFSVFPSEQPDFRNKPVNDLEEITTQHVRSMVDEARGSGVYGR